MLVRNRSQDHLLVADLRVADSFITRLCGLMFRRELPGGEGLLIRPCNSVHTHFMRFPIDVIFVDREWRVLHLILGMRPWRHSPVVRGSVAVLELGNGAAGATRIGDVLETLAQK